MTNNAQHTPGPYHADLHCNGVRTITTRNADGTIGRLCVALEWLSTDDMPEPERDSVTCLLARAPDLLAENERLRAALAEYLRADDALRALPTGNPTHEWGIAEAQYRAAKVDARAALNHTPTE